jgi:L-rhamnose-H+ transport protein
VNASARDFAQFSAKFVVERGMGQTTAGMMLLIVAGITNASFSLPMKFTRKWRWENTWVVWSVLALIVLPVITTIATVPSLGAVYRHGGARIIFEVALFGAGWGVAQVLFGLAIDAIGIALAFSIVLGLSAAIGSLIPLVWLHADKILSPAGYANMAGVVLVVAGVSTCAVAGRMRERLQTPVPAENHKSSARGLTIAIVSGICAALMNFGVAFGGPLISAAAAAGAKPHWTINAVWLPLMIAGAIPNVIYCVLLLGRNRTSDKFSAGETGFYWLLAFVMAVFWFGSTLLYGVASTRLGTLGPVIGWPLFMSLIVITASMLGIATGEWKNAGKKPLRIQLAGVFILIVAVVVLSRASLYI